jgi:hypothetical protein
MSPFRHRGPALAGLVLAASVITPSSALAAAPPRAAAADTVTPSTGAAEVAAGYLIRQLNAPADGAYLTSYGYPDYGLTVDAVLALTAAGVGKDTATAATDYVAANLGSYMSYDTDIYSGSVAKAAFLAEVQGRDATVFGGKDLIATLHSLKDANGQFKDKVTNPAYEYSNTFGQSFAVLALKRAGQLPADAVSFLEAQQCTDGGFPMYAEGNNRPAGSPCVSDADATAMAVQALIAANGVGDPVVAKGLQSLANAQGSTGGLGSTGAQAGANGNSTGLAGQAFLAGGRTANARAAVSFLDGLAYGCDLPAALRGGIAYDADAYRAQVSAGASATPADVDRRSTAQATLALAGTPLFALTSAGAVATAPTLQCATTTPTATATPTGTATPTATSTQAATATPTATATTTATSTPTRTPRPTATATGTATPTVAPTSAAPSPTSTAVAPVATSTPAPPTPGTTNPSLPFTGSESLRLVALGLTLLVAGTAAVIAVRRRGTHA